MLDSATHEATKYKHRLRNTENKHKSTLQKAKTKGDTKQNIKRGK
jgi:hypothetical protein